MDGVFVDKNSINNNIMAEKKENVAYLKVLRSFKWNQCMIADFEKKKEPYVREITWGHLKNKNFMFFMWEYNFISQTPFILSNLTIYVW